ncbi:MAG: SMP-30/gluconolactonase/LRE family protein [Burkholderiaceae bacterium]
MSLYPPPKHRDMQVWSSVPQEYRRDNTVPAWAVANKAGQAADSFLEGPSFDRADHLWVTDIPYGRVFRISPAGQWQLVAEYDGWPNGLKIHRDGRIFITDYRHGLMVMDAATGKVSPYLIDKASESFKGVNDLFFDQQGQIWFTDQGQTGQHDPSGRVYRFNESSGALHCLIDTCPSPNGLVMSCDEQSLFVAMTRGNAVWRLPMLANGNTTKVGIFTHMAGGISGADGMAIDEQDNLYVCDAGNGCVWVFSKFGEPLVRYMSPGTGRTTTNLAFGGPDRQTLYVTESDSGNILTAPALAPGKVMYSHS